jgi:hypothetical protein
MQILAFTLKENKMKVDLTSLSAMRMLTLSSSELEVSKWSSFTSPHLENKNGSIFSSETKSLPLPDC